MPKQKGKQPHHKRTIALELLQRWKQLNRKGDPEKIAEQLVHSKPTIDKALIYGCVHQQSIIDGINKYFADRLMNEKQMAEDLLRLSESLRKVSEPAA